METEFLAELPRIGFVFMVAVWAATVCIHVFFAAGVARDTGQLVRSGSETVFVGPMIWVFAVLFGGVFVAGLYWLVHHSALRRERIWSAES